MFSSKFKVQSVPKKGFSRSFSHSLLPKCLLAKLVNSSLELSTFCRICIDMFKLKFSPPTICWYGIIDVVPEEKTTVECTE